jgi:uncharacterized membrane protein (UPF0127 family)
MIRIRITAVLKACFLACLPIMACCTCQACPLDNKTTNLKINDRVLTVEVAETTASRRCGLAFRQDLPPNQGMLFVFEQDRPVRFWMKNTRIPLTIAYLDADGNILKLEDMDPGDPKRLYPSAGPVRYALETNLGWFAANAIRIGDRAEFSLP